MSTPRRRSAMKIGLVTLMLSLALFSPTSSAVELAPCHTVRIGTIHFSPYSSHLWESQKDKLRDFVEEIAGSSCTIVYVRGYTAKTIYGNGSRHYRNQLSKARSLVAHAFIQQRLDMRGIDIDLRASWFAGRQPTATNETPAGQAKNRRVMVSFLSADEN